MAKQVTDGALNHQAEMKTNQDLILLQRLMNYHYLDEEIPIETSLVTRNRKGNSNSNSYEEPTGVKIFRDLAHNRECSNL